MRTHRFPGLLAAIAIPVLLGATAARATPIVTASQTLLAVGSTVTIDLAFDAGTDAYAGFLLTFEATEQLELVSFVPTSDHATNWSADLGAGVFSLSRSLLIDESGRFELGQLTVRVVADGAALSLGSRSEYVTPGLTSLYLHTDPLASTQGGAAATLIPPPPPPPKYVGGGAIIVLDTAHQPAYQLGSMAPIPEPATAIALLAGLTTLTWRRRAALAASATRRMSSSTHQPQHAVCDREQ